MKRVLFGFAAIVVFGSGCGSVSNDPITVMRDPTATPSLALPVSEDALQILGYGSTVFGRFGDSGSTQFLVMLNPSFNVGTGQAVVSVVAPEAGLITATSTATDAGFVSLDLYFNARFQIRLRNLSQVLVRPGDFVAKGASLGAVNMAIGTPTSLGISVFLDGTAVCPYTWLNTSFKSIVNARLFGTGPCDL